MADNRKLAAGLRNLPASAREDLAGREQDIQRGKTVELLRRAGKEMYENPIVNTAIGFTPVLGDIQAAGETMAALGRGAPWQETAGYAAGMLPFMPMIGKTVWHGSPHTFEKFDLSKIGTGEGAQAYGHGLYLAESPEVASGYRESLSGVSDKVLNASFSKDPELWAASQIYSKIPDSDIVDGLSVLGYKGNPQKLVDSAKNRLKQELSSQGSLYKVDLPDEQIAKMLDWDKPLSQQAPEIQAAIKNSPYAETLSKNDAWYGKEPTADQLYFRLSDLTSPKEASEYFASQGVPGIQYLDQASRNQAQRFIARSPQGGESVFNSAEEAQQFIENMAKRGHKFEYVDPNLTRNYVVFSDEIPQILERNNQPVGMFK